MAQIKLFALLALTLCIGGSLAVDYCNLPFCNDRHIACRNNGSFHYTCPQDARMIDMAPHRDTILRLFNEMRNTVAGGKMEPLPKAARMAEMQWCYELEHLANLNVRLCKSQHDKCRNTERFIYAGQNIATAVYSGDEVTYSDSEIIKDRIEDWFVERKYVTQEIINSYPAVEPENVVGHFTIAVNERNSHIGCSAARFTKDFYNHFIFVCNFASNNLIGRPVYTIAETPTTGCLNRYGASYEYPNLCFAKEIYDNDKP